MTSTFEFLIPKVDHFMPVPREPIVPIGIGSFVFNLLCQS